MMLVCNLGMFVLGLALLYYGADFLVRGGVRIAAALKVPTIIVGLTLVAFATSAPELVVSIDAALKCNGDISLGNVVGSNICNIGLILGLASVISPMNVHSQLLRFDTPVLLLASAVLTCFCYMSGGVSRLHAALLLLLFGIYMFKTVMDGLRQSQGCEAKADKQPTGSIPLSCAFVLGGILALISGAKLFVNASISIARICHVSDAIIGLTVVAVGTSLPELATSTVAAIKGEKDIAVGNVVGSNIFNILAILGIAPLISPIQAQGVGTVDMLVMLALTIAMTVMMCTGKVVRRVEGTVLLLAYLGYVAWLCLGNA